MSESGYLTPVKCRTCGETKPLIEYYWNQHKDCKACTIAKNALKRKKRNGLPQMKWVQK